MREHRFSPAHKCASTIEHGYIKSDAGAVKDTSGRSPGRFSHQISQLQGRFRVSLPRQLQDVLASVRLVRLCAQIRRSAKALKQPRQPVVVHASTFRMKVE